MKSNYCDESIPDYEEAFQDVKRKADNLVTLPKFKFSDFYRLNSLNEYEFTREIRLKFDLTEKQRDFKAVYIFYDKNEPVYVGISKNVFQRIKNHFLGKTHNTASLAFLIARDQHERHAGTLYNGERKNFPFDSREAIQDKMRNNWLISLIPEECNYRLYLLEFYLSCKLKTKWNTFETH